MTTQNTSSPAFVFFDEAHQAMQQHLRTLQQLVIELSPSDWNATQKDSAREIFDFFEQEAMQHHMDEEKHVFPSIVRSATEEELALVEHLKQDHGWIETDWRLIEPMLSAAIEGNTIEGEEVLRQAVEVFATLCTDHLLLEETLAYPAAKANWNQWSETGAAKDMQKRRAGTAER